MEYTKQQKEALNAIERFLNSQYSIFILKGYAGTGKTTLIRPILSVAKSTGKTCQLMAPTGRAAKVLFDKTGYGATTIHKAIYELSDIEAVEGDETQDSKIAYRFPLRQLSNAKRPGAPSSPDQSLLIIDESSMISSRKAVGDLFVFGSGVLLDDILKYARLEDGGKILFVGDPAQLPPVGDPDSYALDSDFLTAKGYATDSFELSEVIRQGSDSTILGNSIKLRNLIQSNIRTELVLDRKEGEFEDIKSEDIAMKYCEMSPKPSLVSPIVICYSNKMVAAYNNEIRSIYFPEKPDEVQVGDKIIIVGNNYASDTRAVLNGEFAIVIDCSSDIEIQTGFVYVDDNTEKKKRVRMDLPFRNVTLLLDDGSIVNKKILDSLLASTQPTITYQEQCALMSNFMIRHRGIKPNSPEFIKALMDDPYYNAIRAKYGYAITCHKSQGGEWDTVFVDYSGRTGLSKDCLRWSYTASTRAHTRMFVHALIDIPKLKARVNEVTTISSAPLEFYPAEVDVPAGPFNGDTDLAPIKAKYWQVVEALEGTGFTVQGIEHQQYRELYTVSDAEGHTFKCDSVYNKSGIMRPFRATNPAEAPEEIMALINRDEIYYFPFVYTPSNQNLEDLYHKVKSACDDYGIVITNIVENLNNYKVSYYLKTDALFAYLEIYVNKHGQVTYINPRSEIGGRDTKLMSLIDAIKE